MLRASTTTGGSSTGSMHYALPSKNGHASSTSLRAGISSKIAPGAHAMKRRKLQQWGLMACGALFVVYVLSKLLSRYDTVSIPAGVPAVVLVTLLEGGYSPEYEQRIRKNRNDYAAQHGYATFYTNASAYSDALNGAEPSWAKIPAMRHAMTLYPKVPYFFYLSPHTLITNPTVSLHKAIVSPHALDQSMLRNKAIVPPDSMIKTLRHVKGADVELVVTSDHAGLSTDSFVIRRGEWAKFFLDTWFDPLFRTFNFQKAETHALEHIVQWHSTVLTRMAIVPQNLINSYSRGSKEELWKKNDFLIRFYECEKREDGRDCEREMDPYWQPLYGQPR